MKFCICGLFLWVQCVYASTPSFLNSEDPVVIEGDEMECSNADHVCVIRSSSNQVCARQKGKNYEKVLSAHSFKVIWNSGALESTPSPSFKGLSSLEAIDNVEYISQNFSLKASYCRFSTKATPPFRDMLICRGNVEIREGDRLAQGDEVEFDLKTKAYKLKRSISKQALIVIAPPKDKKSAK